MYLIPHDGTITGDSNFWAEAAHKINEIPESIEEVKKIWRNVLIEKGDFEQEEIESIVIAIRGAWIINDNTKNILDTICADTSGDSSAYTCNRICKGIAANQAIHIIGIHARR